MNLPTYEERAAALRSYLIKTGEGSELDPIARFSDGDGALSVLTEDDDWINYVVVTADDVGEINLDGRHDHGGRTWYVSKA